MADPTWRATAQGVAYAQNKDMLDVFNAAGSAKRLKVYRAWHFNNGTASITGVLTQMNISRLTAASSGTAVTPVAHDSASAALEAQTTAGHNRTVTRSSLFRQYIYSNDEPTVSGATIDEWELLVPFAQVWGAGYGDANVEPIVCNAGEGFCLYNVTNTTVSTADLEIEFTNVT